LNELLVHVESKLVTPCILMIIYLEESAARIYDEKRLINHIGFVVD